MLRSFVRAVGGLCRIRFVLSTTLGLFLLSSFFLFTSSERRERFGYQAARYVPQLGEHLVYSAKYGVFDAGEGSAKILPTTVDVRGRACYRMEVKVRTSGVLSLFYKVNDSWVTHCDTSTLLPQRFHRYLRENRYRQYEIIDFYPDKKYIEVTDRDGHDTTRTKRRSKYAWPRGSVQDMLSAGYYLRRLDLRGMVKHGFVTVPVFYEDSVYRIKVKYLGKEFLHSPWEGEGEGEDTYVRSFVLSPVLEENHFFRGEHPLRLWFSDDEHRFPLKLVVTTFAGTISVQLEEVVSGR